MTSDREAAVDGSARDDIGLRLEEISAALFRIASLDFSESLQVRLDGSVIDSVVGGINMLSEELQAQLAERDIAEQELEQRVRDRTAELQTSLEALAQYRVLFEMSHTLALVMDPDGTIRHASPGWLHVMGQSESALTGRSVWLFVHPDDWRNEAAESATAAPGAERVVASLESGERRWRAASGEYRQLVWQTTLDAGHGIACAVAHDVTELRRAYREAEEAQARATTASRIKSRFLANMSHEIRTPMSNVLGMTALALEEGLAGAAREYVEAAHASAQSLLAIVNDILDISKIEAGKLVIESISFSPRRELETALTPLFLRARAKKLATSLAIAEGVPDRLLGDSVRFRQVLVNLVSNALKFTDVGAIAVQVAMDDGDHIHVAVTDTGPGVAKEHAETIFEAFRQADDSTARTFGGTGLGLTICKELTRLMGGALWLESELGNGSTFHFTAKTPAAQPESVKKLPAAVNTVEGGGRRLRVLLAEDNEVSARLATRLLERSDCDVVRVPGGRRAVEEAALGGFDLVLMDIQMPGMDGIEATGHIRRAEARLSGVHVPIWALTANAMKGDDLACVQAGMDGHLAKPIDRVALTTLLTQVRRDIAGG